MFTVTLERKNPYIIYLGLISVMNRHRFLGLVHFFSNFQQKISQALHHEAFGGRTPAKGSIKSSHNDSAHSVAHSSLGLLAVDCVVPHTR